VIDIYKIGILGYGVIGRAIENSFKKFGYNVFINDIKQGIMKLQNFKNKKEISELCDFIFLCVPTPTTKNGCNTSALEKCIEELNEHNAKGIVIIKSTIIPETTKKIIKKYPKLKIIYSPEFLTEKNAEHDFLNPDRIVFSGKKEYVDKVCNLFRSIFSKQLFLKYEDPTIAEMGKYASNCFLATKVSYSNQIKLICEKLRINPSEVMKIVKTDHRIGKTHLDPTKGPYGGMCLPKDVKAIIIELKKRGIEIPVLEAVEKINKVIKK